MRRSRTERRVRVRNPRAGGGRGRALHAVLVRDLPVGGSRAGPGRRPRVPRRQGRGVSRRGRHRSRHERLLPAPRRGSLGRHGRRRLPALPVSSLDIRRRSGRCVSTGIGDPPPPGARLFAFPTREKYGVVFAFNGAEPLFELADLDVPSGDVAVRVDLLPMSADPWTFCANVPDFQHFLGVHRTLRDDIGHYDRIRWSHVRPRVRVHGVTRSSAARRRCRSRSACRARA